MMTHWTITDVRFAIGVALIPAILYLFALTIARDSKGTRSAWLWLLTVVLVAASMFFPGSSWMAPLLSLAGGVSAWSAVLLRRKELV